MIQVGCINLRRVYVYETIKLKRKLTPRGNKTKKS